MARPFSVRPEQDTLLSRFEAPPQIMRYVVPKSFIAIGGTSATVVEAGGNTLPVSLVHFTQESIIVPERRPPRGITEDLLAASGLLTYKFRGKQIWPWRR